MIGVMSTEVDMPMQTYIIKLVSEYKMHIYLLLLIFNYQINESDDEIVIVKQSPKGKIAVSVAVPDPTYTMCGWLWKVNMYDYIFQRVLNLFLFNILISVQINCKKNCFDLKD